MNRFRVAIFTLFTVGCALTLVAKDEVPVATGRDGILTAELKAHVYELADDKYMGRDTLYPGCRMARDYLVAEFERYGLEPLPGQENFSVPYQLNVVGFDREGTKLTLGKHEAKAGVDFTPFPFSGIGEVEGEVVFVGYGVDAPKLGFNDYSGLDVKGKIVFMLRHTPHEDDPEHPLTGSAHAAFLTKLEKAQKHGAVGMILVTDPKHHQDGDDLRLQQSLFFGEVRGGMRALRQGGSRFPAIHVSRELAERMVSGSGKTLLDLQRAIDSGKSPSSLKVPATRARITVARNDVPTQSTTYNVAGCIRGSDPAHRDDWVVVGAHYDHVGGYTGAGDTVFNGADDNASGTAGLLELAQAFADRGRPPARSIAFVAFSGEEKGLLGSRAFVANGVLPVERTKFMLNLDMIGRNPERAIEVGGEAYGVGLEALVRRENAAYRLDLDFQGTNYQGNSDHDSFFREGIPFLFFHTGLHVDYHQLGDHADKIAFERMESILRMSYGVLDALTTGDYTPRLIHHVTWLGVQLRELEEEPTHSRISTIDEESRGAKAGLRAGDVITKVGKLGEGNVEGIGDLLRKVQPGDRVLLEILRDGLPDKVLVERARVGFIGIFPGPVDADERKKLGLPDNEGVLVRQLAPTGPAGAAGLKAGDIILRISGQPVVPGTLRSRLVQIGAGETVDLTILRDGERMVLPITLAQRRR